MTILEIHIKLSTTVLIYNFIMMFWSFALYFRRQPLDSNFWGALVIHGTLFIAQAVVGTIMMTQGSSPARWVHILYGILGVITIPAVFGFTRGRDTYYEALMYGLAMLFLLGVITRAMTTNVPLTLN